MAGMKKEEGEGRHRTKEKFDVQSQFCQPLGTEEAD